jgi:hypothetical protein
MLASDRVGPASTGRGPRPWTAEEANARLPELRETLPNLRAWVVRLRKVHADRRRLSDFWGKEFEAPDHPDRPLRLRLIEEEHELSQLLEEALERLDQDGIEVKDLEAGLVDFRSERDGQPVYLCWLRGEPAVAHYHTPEGGYRSRRPISPSAGPVLPPDTDR